MTIDHPKTLYVSQEDFKWLLEYIEQEDEHLSPEAELDLKLREEVFQRAGVDEINRLIQQPDSELDGTFLGFLNVYEAARTVASKNSTIIDFGCHMAAQSYLFEDYAKYIGVDIIANLERFSPQNAEHYIMSIQDFIATHPETVGDESIFAICSYVPDSEARKLVRQSYPNCLVYYPH